MPSDDTFCGPHYRDEISPVKLPEQGQNWAAGTTASVSGWGSTEVGGPWADKLQAVNVTLMSDIGEDIQISILWTPKVSIFILERCLLLIRKRSQYRLKCNKG